MRSLDAKTLLAVLIVGSGLAPCTASAQDGTKTIVKPLNDWFRTQSQMLRRLPQPRPQTAKADSLATHEAATERDWKSYWLASIAGRDTSSAKTAIDTLRAAIATEKEERESWKVSIRMGLDGDEASDDESRTEIQSGVSIERGSYPSELRFQAETDLTIESDRGEDKTTEDVATLLANFDHHLTSYFEVYVFVERFTDNFMDIDRRYEAGFGFQLGDWFGSPHLTPDQKKAGIQEFPLDDTRRALSSAADQKARNDVDAFLDELAIAQASIKHRQAKVFLGMACSVFYEIEQSKIAIPGDSLVPTQASDKELNPPSENQIRWVLRPTLAWRPTPPLTVQAMCYFKFGRSTEDRRTDFDARIKCALDKGGGFGDVGIVIQYLARHDTEPWKRSRQEIANEFGVMIVPSEIEAPKEHSTARLLIEVEI